MFQFLDLDAEWIKHAGGRPGHQFNVFLLIQPGGIQFFGHFPRADILFAAGVNEAHLLTWTHALAGLLKKLFSRAHRRRG